MRRSHQCYLHITLLTACLLSLRSTRARDTPRKAGDVEDISGPVVKHSIVDNTRTTEVHLNASTVDDAIKKKTIAQIIDEALEQEFPEEKGESIGRNYNETAQQDDATVETVIKVSQNKRPDADEKPLAPPPPTPTATPAEQGVVNSIIHSSWGHLGSDKKPVMQTPPSPVKDPEKDAGKQKQKERQRMDHSMEKEVDRIIDSQDNVYVLSKPKDGSLGLTLDPQLIRDLTVLITSSAAGGALLESLKQPVINGFFIAGSIVGPGGLKLIKELVQVESLAQLGVQLLLFTLGLEFSVSKLRVVRSVALLGGMIEILLFIIVAGLLAHVIGASVHEGIFVGALVSMSSTSIVIKCLHDSKSTASPHGQITIGTLILQDCMVGLLFAFMPVLANNQPGGGASKLDAIKLLFRVTLSLALLVALAWGLARSALPWAMALLARNASTELYQLCLLAFCLLAGWLSGYMGLSTELGAFVAGVMLSATEQQEHALGQLQHLKSFFLSLFISSTGLVMSPRFLAQHLPVLAGGLLLTLLSKTVLISTVVWVFNYPVRTALAVGLSMAQIGEFAFVLLSVASQLGLLPYQVYMLLMGITALSLLVTPFLMQLSQLLLQDGEHLASLPSHGNAWAGLPKAKLSRRLSSGEMPSSPHSADSPPASLQRDREALSPSEVASNGSSSTRLDHRHGHGVPPGATAYPSEVQLQQRYPYA